MHQLVTDIRNAYEAHDREALEAALARLVGLPVRDLGLVNPARCTAKHVCVCGPATRDTCPNWKGA